MHEMREVLPLQHPAHAGNTPLVVARLTCTMHLLFEQLLVMMVAATDLTTTTPAARVQARQVQQQLTMLPQPGLQVGLKCQQGDDYVRPACLPACDELHPADSIAASPGSSSDGNCDSSSSSAAAAAAGGSSGAAGASGVHCALRSE